MTELIKYDKTLSKNIWEPLCAEHFGNQSHHNKTQLHNSTMLEPGTNVRRIFQETS